MFTKRKPALYACFTMLFVASLILEGCGGAKTPPVSATNNGNASPQPSLQTSPLPSPSVQAQKKVATFIWNEEFDSLNPMYSNMWFSTITEQLWDCWPWNYDENNNPIPNLVTEIPSLQNGDISPDGSIITLHLRDGLMWSDKQPLTSEDFHFTWAMAIDSKNTVASSYPYSKITAVDTPDPKTVVIHFDGPFAPWLTTFKGILPAHILQPVYDADGTLDKAGWNTKPTVGCGPYVFAEWQSGSFARFTTNPNYWGTKPKIDEIFIRFVPDNASQITAMTNGDGDLTTFFPYNEIPKLKTAGLTIMTEPTGLNESLFFLDDTSGKLGNLGLRDVNVRKAIAMAIDREGIVRDLMIGMTTVPASYWSALPPIWNNPPLQNYLYDPQVARNLLEQAGWKVNPADGVREKNGVKLDLIYGTTNENETRQNVQAVIQQQLAAIGIKVELKTFSSDTFFAQDGPAATGQVDIMEWSDGPSVPDPDVYYWYCSEIPTASYPAGSNWQYLCDSALDALSAKQITQVDPVERQKTISQMNQIFYDKVYWLGLWVDPDLWAVGKRLTGVKFSGATPFFNITDWDLTSK